MSKIITILLILVSTLAFSQTDTPTHISKLEKEYDTHKALGWTSIGLSGTFYGLGAMSEHKPIQGMSTGVQYRLMGILGVTFNIKGIYHIIKANKIKKQIYRQKFIINLYSYE
jgi:hypothetical protein